MNSQKEKRALVKNAFVENVYNIIQRLEELRGANGERFHIFISSSNFGKAEDKRNLARNRVPTINVGVIYGADLPDSVTKDARKLNAQEVVKRYASENHKDFVALYNLKAAIAINIDPNGINVTRYDNRCTNLMAQLPGEKRRKWQVRTVAEEVSCTRLNDLFAHFVSSKSALDHSDMIAFSALITKPPKLSMREKIGLWRQFG